MTIIEIFSDGEERISHNVRDDAAQVVIYTAKFWNLRALEGQPRVSEIRIVFDEVQHERE